jgi:hypothetical protein
MVLVQWLFLQQTTNQNSIKISYNKYRDLDRQTEEEEQSSSFFIYSKIIVETIKDVRDAFITFTSNKAIITICTG